MHALPQPASMSTLRTGTRGPVHPEVVPTTASTITVATSLDPIPSLLNVHPSPVFRLLVGPISQLGLARVL